MYSHFILPTKKISRRLGDGSSRDSSDDFTELNRAQSQAISMSQTLLVEIRQAVNEAQPRGKMVIFNRISFLYFWFGFCFRFSLFSRDNFSLLVSFTIIMFLLLHV